MAQGFNQLVSALQRRYDYHSARAVLLEALDAVGLEKRASYEDKEWAKLLTGLLGVGDELEGVWQALGDAPKGVRLPKPSSSQSSEDPSESVAGKPSADREPEPEPEPEKPTEKAKATAKSKAKPKSKSKAKKK